MPNEKETSQIAKDEAPACARQSDEDYRLYGFRHPGRR